MALHHRTRMTWQATLLFGLLAAGSVTAQPVSRLADLERRVHEGQTLFVLDRSGERTEGRFVRLTEEGLAVEVEHRIRTIPGNSILRIDRRDSVANGAAIGAAVLGLPAALGAGASCSPDCGRTMALAGVVFGAIGGGIGALIDGNIRGYSPVYTAGPGSAISAPPSPAPLAPEAAPPADSPPGAGSSLAYLWPEVRPGDKVEVVTTTGSTTGHFLRSTSQSVAVSVDGAVMEAPASAVLRVNRIGHHTRRGAMIGLLAGVGLGVADLATTDDGGFSVAPVMSGAFWGGVIGWMIPSRTVVYDFADSETQRVHARFTPVIASRQTGVLLAVDF